MTTKRKKTTNTRLRKSIIEIAEGLYDAGIMDKTTLREFDTLKLPPVKELAPNDIKKIRLREKVSQAVFAKFLNISPSTVRQWEQGDKHPQGGLLKLLNLVDKKGLRILT